MRVSTTLRVFVYLILICAFFDAAQGRTVTGTVSAEGHPVSGALVRIQTTDRFVLTDTDGRFSLDVNAASGKDIYVTAGKEGFYNSRSKLTTNEVVIINLKRLPTADNRSYQWQDPTPSKSNPDNCGNCHQSIYGQWKVDAHSRASEDLLVTTLYE